MRDKHASHTGFAIGTLTTRFKNGTFCQCLGKINKYTYKYIYIYKLFGPFIMIKVVISIWK